MNVVGEVSALRPRRILATVLFFFIFLILMPWTPFMPRQGLDPSWNEVMHFAFASRLQYGRDLIFTYGPLGFVESGLYCPETYRWVFAIRGVILLLVGLLYFRLLGRLPLSYAVACALGIVAASNCGPDAIYGSVPVFEGLILTNEEVSPTETLVLAILCGAASLVKFTFLVTIVTVGLLAAVYRAIRWRELPIHLTLSLLAMMVWFVAIGQHPSSFAEFLRGSFEATAGYSEAMQVEGPLPQELFFCALAASLVLIFASNELHRRRPWPILPVAAIVLILFMVFKEGFVRHDDGHLNLAFSWLVVIAGLCVAWISRPREQAVAAIVFVLSLGWLLTASGPAAALRAVSNRVAAVYDMVLHGTRKFDAEYEAAHAQIRTDAPLPAVSGEADIYPVQQSTLIANGIRYRPRPVFQSYAAYTDYLIKRNVDFLKSARAPATIFLGGAASMDACLLCVMVQVGRNSSPATRSPEARASSCGWIAAVRQVPTR
jgi:hypothetical protein